MNEVPIHAWFPTFVYYADLQKAWARFNAELLREAHQIREFDEQGRDWSKTNYPGGYTSYHSMCHLHRFSSTFEQLEKKITRHVKAFAKHLDFDLRGRTIQMSDCWVNIMPRQAVHGLHLHPLSFISGTYYVQTPPGCSRIKFEDPRLSKFMAAPPRVPRHRPENKLYVSYEAQAGKLVLFESWLRHEVAANPTDEERISISFNYDWK